MISSIILIKNLNKCWRTSFCLVLSSLIYSHIRQRCWVRAQHDEIYFYLFYIYFLYRTQVITFNFEDRAYSGKCISSNLLAILYENNYMQTE